jgi:antitoxin (DNA-binding transcriptional repressor) of toxin-antitoxin stability system
VLGWFAAGSGALTYSGRVGEIPLEEVPREVTDAAYDAARGQVVYLTEHGERLAAIVPAELENLTPEQFRELLEDFADAQAAASGRTSPSCDPGRDRRGPPPRPGALRSCLPAG